MKYRNWLLYHGMSLFILLFPFIQVALVGNDHARKSESGMVELDTFLSG
jgi:hypothetical protein